jgi:predicted RNA methylase
MQVNDSTSKPNYSLSASYFRNIRDAGIALVAFLGNVTRKPFPETPLAMNLTRITHGPKVLELGSGCGIVGLEIARLCPTSDVLLTDLPEAMAIMEYNVSEVKGSSAIGKIATAILDWDDALPAMIKQTQYDLVIVSDCTYNSDNIPALVKTLAAVVNKSPAALVVVSMKVRHDSEAIFFELMAEAGFVTVEDYAISLHDQQRGHNAQERDVVNVFVFRKD